MMRPLKHFEYTPQPPEQQSDLPQPGSSSQEPNPSATALGSSFSTNKTYKAWTPQKPASAFSASMLQIKQFNSDCTPYVDADYQPQRSDLDNFGY